MIFTQRILWGEKGLMRKIKWSPLNIEQREKELRIRRKMLKAHQAVGFVTLAGFIAQGIIGVQLYNGNYSNYKFHKTVGHLTSISYFSGAGLSLFSPPPLINKKIKPEIKNKLIELFFNNSSSLFLSLFDIASETRGFTI